MVVRARLELRRRRALIDGAETVLLLVRVVVEVLVVVADPDVEVHHAETVVLGARFAARWSARVPLLSERPSCEASVEGLKE